MLYNLFVINMRIWNWKTRIFLAFCDSKNIFIGLNSIPTNLKCKIITIGMPRIISIKWNQALIAAGKGLIGALFSKPYQLPLPLYQMVQMNT